MATIETNRFTCYPTFEAALALAKANLETDADWTYKVESNSFGFFVAIYDEDGERVGTL